MRKVLLLLFLHSIAPKILGQVEIQDSIINEPNPEQDEIDGLKLYLLPDKDTVGLGDTINYQFILGDPYFGNVTLNGVFISISHHISELNGSIIFPDPVDPCFLGATNVDYYFEYHLTVNSLTLDLYRPDNTNVEGFGPIATSRVVIPDNLGESISDFRFDVKYVNISITGRDTITPEIIQPPVQIVNEVYIPDTLQEQNENYLAPYPNPTSDYLNIEQPNEGVLFEIFNFEGTRVKAQILTQGLNMISISEFPPGSYYAILHNKDGQKTHQIIIL